MNASDIIETIFKGVGGIGGIVGIFGGGFGFYSKYVLQRQTEKANKSLAVFEHNSTTVLEAQKAKGLKNQYTYQLYLERALEEYSNLWPKLVTAWRSCMRFQQDLALKTRPEEFQNIQTTMIDELEELFIYLQNTMPFIAPKLYEQVMIYYKKIEAVAFDHMFDKTNQTISLKQVQAKRKEIYAELESVSSIMQHNIWEKSSEQTLMTNEQQKFMRELLKFRDELKSS